MPRTNIITDTCDRCGDSWTTTDGRGVGSPIQNVSLRRHFFGRHNHYHYHDFDTFLCQTCLCNWNATVARFQENKEVPNDN